LIAQLGLHSTAPTATPVAGADFTGTIAGVEWYDGIRVQAVLNQIAGFDHTGTRRLGVSCKPAATFFGRPYAEALMLRLAYAYEQATHHRAPPKTTPPLPAAEK
jgi:Asp-tRNA(Asn)/Glu-tRNA(Gln) amidotransferase A subunit family amidase